MKNNVSPVPAIKIPAGRIEVADVLRGFAVISIIILHSMERFSLFNYPETTCRFLQFTDSIISDGLYFAFGGKSYAIFALLFGFTFFIQDNSQKLKGKDFRPRFAWRLLLLMVIACFNSMMFPGEILVLYAIVGYVLIPVARMSTRAVMWIAAIFLLQPVELVKIVYALFNPDYAAGPEIDAPYWAAVNTAQMEGSFLEMCKTAIWKGNLGNMGWMWRYGRFFQTAALFMIGMIIGRTEILKHSERNLKLWFRVLIISLVSFFPLYGLANAVPSFIENSAIHFSLSLILTSLSNMAFTGFLFSAVILVYYTTRFGNVLHKLAPYGRMSMTNYITQSILGSFLFYHWGLGLYQYFGVTFSTMFGVGIFVVQYIFCIWWLRRHTHGPVEWLWKKATWVTVK